MEKLSNTIASVRERLGVWSSRVLIISVLLFIFFIAGGGMSHNAKWRIEQIEISGAKTVPEDVVRSLVRQKLVGNYFFVYARENSRIFPRKEIEQMLLEAFPRIKEVSIKRLDNNTLLSTIAERTPYALWCGEELNKVEGYEFNDCWFIDENGFVFDRAPIFSKGVYMEVYGKLVGENKDEPLRASLPHTRFVVTNSFAKLLHEKIGKPYRVSIKPEGESEVAIYTSAEYPFLNDTVVHFNDESKPEILMKNLLAAIPVQFPNNLALKKKLLYIDMRFGNKVIFGFEN